MPIIDMIISNRITRKYLVVIICTIIAVQFTESHLTNHLNRTFRGFSRDNYNHGRPSQEQNNATDRSIGTNTEIDQLIRYAMNAGIFQSKEEWTKQHNTVQTTSSNSYNDDDKTNRIMRRTTKGRTENDSTPVSEPTRSQSDAILFPDNPNSQQVQYVPQSDVCKGNSICEDVPNYPEEAILNAIKKYKGELFSINEPLPENAELDVGQRIGEADSRSETVEFCSRQVERIQPTSGNTVNGERRFIVNTGNVIHILATEKCLNTDSQCNFTTGLLVLGYYPSCVQKYVNRELHALQPNGTVSREPFPIPVSCCCELRFDGTMNRMKTSNAPLTKD